MVGTIWSSMDGINIKATSGSVACASQRRIIDGYGSKGGCEKMKCKNMHCNGTQFVGVIETDKNNLVGVKCMNCGARYSMDEIVILDSVKRIGWNSVSWILAVGR